MKSRISRRAVVGAGVAMGAGSLLSSGPGGSVAAEVAAPGPSPASPASPASASGYRDGQTYLFQSVAVASYPSALGGGTYSTDNWGPTHAYVDAANGWMWRHPGGDWVDRQGVPQGPDPWFSASVDAASGSNVSHVYDIDVTKLVAHCQQQDRWLALVLRARGAPRSMASTFHPTLSGPAIVVTYADGSRAALRCRVVAASTASSSQSLTIRASLPLPCFVEFDRPDREVRAARLRLAVTEHWSGGRAFIDGDLCDPPRRQAMDDGPLDLSARAGELDEGIERVAGVIGAQRYLDGRSLAQFAVTGPVPSISSESSFDPALWGGRSDTSRFPHTVVGKWVNVPTGMSLVSSSFRGEGFEPLRPRLGALRVVMPDGGIRTGQEGGTIGTVALNARLFMPFEEMGRLDHIFVRQYVRLGTPHVRVPTDRREVLRGGQPAWTDMGGKFGIQPSHATTYGGGSGSSGGGDGWQMRWSWTDCDAAVGGPDEQGITPGWHLYDFQGSNPVGHRYGNEGQSVNSWGQQGPRGAVLYAGRWYCIETELKLNSVNMAANTWRADGLLRAWVDGTLVYERTGMVFRAPPLRKVAFNDIAVRPCRELGVRDLWWNWYHGGTTQSSVRRTMFVSGLVWARARIGPMR